MKNKLMSKIVESGVWLQPGIMTFIVRYIRENNLNSLNSYKDWIYCFILSLLPILILNSGKSSKSNAKTAWTGKESAMYPALPSNILYKNPQGVVLGRDIKTSKYVCKCLKEDGHVFVIGGSGSGKSSCLVIPTLVSNPKTTVFAIDIKGELSFKSTRYGNDKVLIFNPADRYKCGYDPLYRLSEDCRDQEIFEVMQDISFSLIPMPASIKDPFWKNSARNLLTGLMIFYYKQGFIDFIDIIDQILSKPVTESIQEVCKQSSNKTPEYRYIVQFSQMAEETLGGIVGEMNNHIVIFSNDQDIRYAFKDNGNKANPHKLEEGYSIYLSIREEKLSAYYDVIQLIINQVLGELERRAEGSPPIIVCIDELPRLLSSGKMEHLLDGARTLRSRNVCLFLVTQSTEALMSAFTENEVADLISNCSYIVVLSATSSKTQKSVCSWCGKYMVKKRSWSNTGKGSKSSIAYDEKDIVSPSDLMTLKNTGEAIIITPYGYGRVKKTPWYKDKTMRKKVEEVIKYNKAIKDMEESI